MIVEFESALVKNYVPYLLPTVRKTFFSTESEMDFMQYFDDKFDKYPTAVVIRSDFTDSKLCSRYEYEDVDDKSLLTCFTYQVTYSIKFFFEKQQKSLDAMYLVRANHALQPYVIFPYREGLNYRIGLRFLGAETESVRANNDKKGALRVLTVKFLSNLVLTKKEAFEIISKVEVSQNNRESDGVQ